MQTAVQSSERSNALSKVFGQINRLEKIEDDIIALLPDMSDDEVMDTRIYAKSLGRSAWRIEVACDREIWNRTEAKRGRGNVDVEGVGIKATVAKRAAELGCTPRTIESNARVAKFVREIEEENDESTFTILDEKGYWQAALSADYPKEAIEHFVNAKLENPFFSVSDAFRWAKEGKDEAEHKSRPKSDKSEVDVLYTPEIQTRFDGLIKTLTEYEEMDWPLELSYIPRLLQNMKAHVNFQKQREAADDQDSILSVIRRLNSDPELGFTKDAQELYDVVFDLGYAMSRKAFVENLKHMSRDDVRMALYTDAGDGKQETRRGALPGIVCLPWRKVRVLERICSDCGEPNDRKKTAENPNICSKCLREY